RGTISWLDVEGVINGACAEASGSCHAFFDGRGAGAGEDGGFVGCCGAQHAGVGHGPVPALQHAQAEGAGTESDAWMGERDVARRAVSSRAAARRISPEMCAKPIISSGWWNCYRILA